MTETNLRDICKWTSVVLVALSVLMLFFGGITVSEKKSREKIADNWDELEDIFEYDDEDLGMAQAFLGMANVDFDIKETMDQMLGIMRILKNGKVSISEMAWSAKDIKDISKKSSELIELMGDDEIEEILEATKKVIPLLTTLQIFFWITIVAGLAVIALHIINNKLPGISIAVLNIIWLIVLGIVTHKVNDFIDVEMEGPMNCFRIAAAPVWAVLFSVSAMFIWMFSDRITAYIAGGKMSMNPIQPGMGRSFGDQAAAGGKKCPICQNMLSEAAEFCSMCGSKYVPPREPVPKPVSSDAPRCSNCGNMLNEGALFCHICGTKYEPPAESPEPDTGVIDEQSVQGPAFCPDCGAPLDSDSVFCGECGFKIK